MPVPALPSEIWRDILEIAVGDDPLLETTPISPLAECTWYEMVFGDWWLRRPREALQMRQRQSYALKKVRSVWTCFQVSIDPMYRRLSLRRVFRLLK